MLARAAVVAPVAALRSRPGLMVLVRRAAVEGMSQRQALQFIRAQGERVADTPFRALYRPLQGTIVARLLRSALITPQQARRRAPRVRARGPEEYTTRVTITTTDDDDGVPGKRYITLRHDGDLSDDDISDRYALLTGASKRGDYVRAEITSITRRAN